MNKEFKLKENDVKNNIFYTNNIEEFYIFKEILGEGCVGLVKKVIRKKDNKEFAIKIVNTKDEETIGNSKKEFINLQKLQHKNIVEAYEFYIDE